MSGAGLQFGRGQGEDKLCNPLRFRRNQHLQRALRSAGITIADPKQAATPRQSRETENRATQEESSKTVPASVPSPSSQLRPPYGNFERFLESTTPRVPAQYLSKTRMRGWRTCSMDFQPFFTLGDLWESFKEWSAYGAGVPLVLDGNESVVQYYVPYLSAVQIYADSSRTTMRQGRQGEDSDGDCYRDSSSDGSSDYEFERGFTHSKEQQDQHHSVMEATIRMERLSARPKNLVFQEELSSDDSDGGNSQTPCLIFEFLEQDPPYSREPLADKIADLTRRFPELKTLKSCDLLAASWISVAWYPIYRIPTGPTLRDLDACFLTYHSLATPMTGRARNQPPVVNPLHTFQGSPMISLQIFGLAAYKFKSSVWMANAGSERHLANSLLQAADNWLRLVQVVHPDFQFFASHGMLQR
ncbi:uncharacterized protein LOC116257763 [Nymphaea colorata]|nr:uncharacterized protein LOC116257763 [Nymphaea colorata]